MTVLGLASRVAARVEVVRMVEVLGGRLGPAAAAVGGLVPGSLLAVVEVTALGFAAVGALAVGAFLSVMEEEGMGLLAVAAPVVGAVVEAGRVLVVVLGLAVEAAAGFAFATSLPGTALLPLARGFAFLALSAGSAFAFFSSFFSSFFSTVFFSVTALLGTSSFTFTGSSSTFFSSSSTFVSGSTLVSGSSFFSGCVSSTLGSFSSALGSLMEVT